MGFVPYEADEDDDVAWAASYRLVGDLPMSEMSSLVHDLMDFVMDEGFLGVDAAVSL